MNATEFSPHLTAAEVGSRSHRALPSPPAGTGPQPVAVEPPSPNSPANRFLHAIREVTAARWHRPVLLARYGWCLWRRRSLSRAFADAQRVLGQRMFEAGIDDGELGARIAALNERTSRAERKTLLVQLAGAALEDDGPLPGADAEYQRAREAQLALQRYDADLWTLRALLQDGISWPRFILNYGVVGVLALLALARAWGWLPP